MHSKFPGWTRYVSCQMPTSPPLPTARLNAAPCGPVLAIGFFLHSCLDPRRTASIEGESWVCRTRIQPQDSLWLGPATIHEACVALPLQPEATCGFSTSG